MKNQDYYYHDERNGHSDSGGHVVFEYGEDTSSTSADSIPLKPRSTTMTRTPPTTSFGTEFEISGGGATPPLPPPLLTTNIYSTPHTDHILHHTRLLEGRISSMTSPGVIGWYCFASVFVGSVLVCVSYLYCRNIAGNYRAQQALNDQIRLESIEANVARWSQVENQRNTRVVKTCLHRNTKAFTPKHSLTAPPRNPRSEEPEDDKDVCGICLEDLVTGQQCVSSSDSQRCRHVFHEACIVGWFVSRRDWLCPTCRQPFVCQTDVSSAVNINGTLRTRQTSMTSQQLSTAFNDTDQATSIVDLTSDDGCASSATTTAAASTVINDRNKSDRNVTQQSPSKHLTCSSCPSSTDGSDGNGNKSLDDPSSELTAEFSSFASTMDSTCVDVEIGGCNGQQQEEEDQAKSDEE